MIDRWHELLRSGNIRGLPDLIADDAVFHSPVLFSPQVGKDKVVMYLRAASAVIVSEHFRYVGEWKNDDSAVLEFETEIDGTFINGVDIIRWEEGKIVDFKVMVRPLKAIETLRMKMVEMMQSNRP